MPSPQWTNAQRVRRALLTRRLVCLRVQEREGEEADEDREEQLRSGPAVAEPVRSPSSTAATSSFSGSSTSLGISSSGTSTP